MTTTLVIFCLVYLGLIAAQAVYVLHFLLAQGNKAKRRRGSIALVGAEYKYGERGALAVVDGSSAGVLAGVFQQSSAAGIGKRCEFTPRLTPFGAWVLFARRV